MARALPLAEVAQPCVWVDADACPVVIREILFRAAERTGVRMVLVANRAVRVPAGSSVRCQVVSAGFDEADNEIVRQISKGDLVITADIPLADEVIRAGGLALDPRGELHTRESIGARLNMRDFLDTLRGSGIDTGGSAPMSARDRQQFANQLDRWLASH